MILMISPLTPEKWNDFEQLFGTHGAFGGFWCMFWRLTRKEFREGCKGKNKQDIRDLVFHGTIPGVLAYADDQPVGWCSVAPREDFCSLKRSRILKCVDNQPVWSIVCFFVRRDFQGKGMMGELIRGAMEYAKSRGAQIIKPTLSYPKRKVHLLICIWAA